VAQLDEVVLWSHATDFLVAARPYLDDYAKRLLPDPLAEVLHDLEADVGLKQRSAHVHQRGIDRAFVQLCQALELLLGSPESLRECLEHGSRNLAQRSHPQATEVTTADDPGRWRRRACASGPQVHQYIPVRFSALLASSPACRPDSKGLRKPASRVLLRQAHRGQGGASRTPGDLLRFVEVPEALEWHQSQAALRARGASEFKASSPP